MFDSCRNHGKFIRHLCRFTNSVVFKYKRITKFCIIRLCLVKKCNSGKDVKNKLSNETRSRERSSKEKRGEKQSKKREKKHTHTRTHPSSRGVDGFARWGLYTAPPVNHYHTTFSNSTQPPHVPYDVWGQAGTGGEPSLGSNLRASPIISSALVLPLRPDTRERTRASESANQAAGDFCVGSAWRARSRLSASAFANRSLIPEPKAERSSCASAGCCALPIPVPVFACVCVCV